MDILDVTNDSFIIKLKDDIENIEEDNTEDTIPLDKIEVEE